MFESPNFENEVYVGIELTGPIGNFYKNLLFEDSIQREKNGLKVGEFVDVPTTIGRKFCLLDDNGVYLHDKPGVTEKLSEESMVKFLNYFQEQPDDIIKKTWHPFADLRETDLPDDDLIDDGK
tara:strand:- start:119 stop:487 length:369 start_codon:yes stop_codon:yes gene_type:complete